MTSTSYYGGAYRRFADGSWRYGANGQVVPGARDILLVAEVPHLRVGPPVHGLVWVPRPIALTHVAMQWVVTEPDQPLASWQLPHDVEGLPPGTQSVMFIPKPMWDRHANDIIGMDAPEMHPNRLMTMEMVAAAIGVTPASLLEYLRRGACPEPPVRIGRTPAWTRPIVEQWMLTRSGRPQIVQCTGCRQPTEMFGIQVTKADGDIGCVPVCAECERRLMPKLNSWNYATKGHLTVADIVSLLDRKGN